MKDRIHKNKNHQQYISRKKEKKKRKKQNVELNRKKLIKGLITIIVIYNYNTFYHLMIYFQENKK